MADQNSESSRANLIVRLYTLLRRPSAHFSLGFLLICGFVAGILFWGGYNWGMELSNTESFCISCHEMESTVYQDLKETVHYSNTTGVRAICSDCHVPRQWHYKFVRKIRATFNELPKHIMGTIDTPEKFQARRMVLARHVWADMKATDSRECRNCHAMKSMKLADQVRPARKKHKTAIEEGRTCIECHQGIAHKLPEDWEKYWKEDWEEEKK